MQWFAENHSVLDQPTTIFHNILLIIINYYRKLHSIYHILLMSNYDIINYEIK